MKIYLASGNKNKKREMSEILLPHTIVTPQDEGIDFEPEETGSTFYENSLIKARDLYSKVHAPVLADDSGLCVDALGGIPGIYSSRYAGPDFPQGNPLGEKISQDAQNRFLLEQLNNALKSFPNAKRTAHYVCAMVLYLGSDRLFVAQETMEGTLVNCIEEARGNGGFGYDPIFIPRGYNVTAAELSSEQKNAISHRGKAVRIIQKLAEGLL